MVDHIGTAPDLDQGTAALKKADFDDRVSKEQLRIFASQTKTTIVGTAIVSTGATVLLWGGAEGTPLLSWWLFINISYLCRLLINNHFQSDIDNPGGVKRWTKRFRIMMAYYGIIWGLFPAMVFDPSTLAGFTYLSICIVGMVGGALGSSSAFKQGFGIFVVCICAPVVVMCLLQGTYDFYIIAGLFSFFVFMMVRFGITQATNLKTHISDKLRVGDLLAEVQAARERERESQAQIEAIFETNPAGISVLSTDGHVLYANPMFENLFGIESSGSQIGRLISDFFVDRNAFVSLFNVQSDTMISQEVEFCRQDGTVWWCQINHGPFEFDGERAVIEWYYDITKQKLAEHEAAEKAQLLETTLANVDQGIIVRDDKDNIVIFNERLSEILDIPYEIYESNASSARLNALHDKQSIGWWENPENHAKIVEWDERRARGLPVDRLSYERPDHRGRTILAVRQPMPNGLEVRTFQDITDLKEAERAALEQNRLLNLTLENMAQGLLVVDNQGKIVLANETYRQQFALPEGYFGAPRTHFDVVRFVNERRYGSGWEKAVEDARLDLRQTHAIRREIHMSDHLVLDLLSVPIPSGGFVVTTTDITERIQASNEIKAARDQAEAATMVKSQFLANMSHEIRTPLSGISGFLELLQLSTLDKTQRHYVKSASMATDSLIGIIGDVLDFSKIEAGHLELNPTKISVAQLIYEVVSLFSPKAAERGCRLAVQLSPNAPTELQTDPLRLRQILTNITGNAVKFAENGLIHLAVDLVHEGDKGPAIRFMVTDTGIGFSQEKADQLFDEFAQADASTTRRFGGTGLGLAICKKLVDLMGGDISCTGEPGNGAVFWFSLPVSQETVATALESPSPSVHAKAGVFVSGHQHEPLLDSVADTCLSAERILQPDQISAGVADLDALVVIADHHDQGLQIAKHITDTAPPIRFLVADRYDFQARQSAFRLGYTHVVTHEDAQGCLAGYVLAANMGSTDLEGADEQGPETTSIISTIEPALRDLPVLLIDDLEMNLTIASRQIDSLGLPFETAQNGKEGLDKAVSKEYSMVIVDCSMPVMDGYEFTEQLRIWERQTLSKRALPVVALTANATVGDAERCFAAGMNDYLSKPVTFRKLAQTVAKWLGASPHPSLEGAEAGGRSSSLLPPHAVKKKTPPVDVSILASIVGDDDPALISSLLHAFKDSFGSIRMEMQDAKDRNALGELARSSHAAKGAAANAGANALSLVLKDIEMAAKAQSINDVEKAWAKLDGLVEGVMQFIDQNASQ